jgi:16S rRNA C967 or C1407 C5-methylase (RsmB/RsmF family)/NOL1/NOP2/fmu family ribosome biogenesis protein
MASLPTDFEKRLRKQFGNDAGPLLDSFHLPIPTSIRINTSRLQLPGSLEKVPWSSSGYYLPERPLFTLNPLLHAGAYYVQEASSMFLEQAVRQAVDLTEQLRILDLCAAPGGKSTLLASLIGADSLLVSNEVIRSRAEILAENLTKWGKPNVIVTNNDPRDFDRLQGFFDMIVVDAPCSGEGLFRKDPEAMNEWSEASAAMCSERQRRILMDVWPALKPGGVLIYSTCTYNPAENEENIQWLSSQTDISPVNIDVAESWKVRTVDCGNNLAGYQFMPHLSKGEGFFLCAVRKEQGDEWQAGRKDKFPLQAAGKAEAQEAAKWLIDERDLVIHQENMLAFPGDSRAAWGAVIQQLRIVQAGVLVAELKKKNLVPAHSLALSDIIDQKAFARWEVTLEEALKYLKKEEWPVDRETDGWQLMTFQGLALGWIKRIGARFNNYYPLHWRIRMELPKDIPSQVFDRSS